MNARIRQRKSEDVAGILTVAVLSLEGSKAGRKLDFTTGQVALQAV